MILIYNLYAEYYLYNDDISGSMLTLISETTSTRRNCRHMIGLYLGEVHD